MKTFCLSNEEAAAKGFTHKWIIEAADLVAAGATTSTVIELFGDGVARDKIENVTYNLVTPFDGTSTTNLAMTIGYDLASGTDDADAFMPSVELHNDATELICAANNYTAISTLTVDATYGTEESTVIASLRTTLNQVLAAAPKVFTEAYDLEATFTATAANLSDLLTGEIHIFARIGNLSKV